MVTWRYYAFKSKRSYDVPKVVSSQRFARSLVTPTGAANEVEQELDFQLGSDDGIRITDVLGYGSLHDDTPTASNTVPNVAVGHQTLHLETGATEDIPDAAGEDAFDVDSEIFWTQWFQQVFLIPTTAGGGGGSMLALPNGITHFDDPIDTNRNIIHKGTTIGADQDGEFGIILFYYFIRFTLRELGLQVARSR